MHEKTAVSLRNLTAEERNLIEEAKDTEVDLEKVIEDVMHVRQKRPLLLIQKAKARRKVKVAKERRSLRRKEHRRRMLLKRKVSSSKVTMVMKMKKKKTKKNHGVLQNLRRTPAAENQQIRRNKPTGLKPTGRQWQKLNLQRG